jgi:hypothetical protein
MNENAPKNSPVPPEMLKKLEEAIVSFCKRAEEAGWSRDQVGQYFAAITRKAIYELSDKEKTERNAREAEQKE